MSSQAASEISITRWTKLSIGFAVVALAVLVLLAIAPALASGRMIDRLTVLFIYVILAAMWNTLAGYGGMISAGQQAFFGIGAYFTIKLSELGVEPYLALVIAAMVAGLLAIPLFAVVSPLRAGEFAIGMWVISEAIRLLVNLDPVIQGDTGRSLIALASYDATTRRAVTYWMALAGMAGLLGLIFAMLRSRLGSSIQAIRDNEMAAASVGVSVTSAKRIIFIIAGFGCALAGGLWLATFTTFQPRSFFGVQWSAYMIFMVLVGGIGRFEGPIIGAFVFFAVETMFGVYGVWYLIVLGLVALVLSLYLPKGIWGFVEERYQISFLPVGYKLQINVPPEANPAVDHK